MPWNEIILSGNPTRSVIVQDLIKSVKEKEVRKKGKSSEADLANEKSEFEKKKRIRESQYYESLLSGINS
jgi:hypothetical protein